MVEELDTIPPLMEQMCGHKSERFDPTSNGMDLCGVKVRDLIPHDMEQICVL